MLITLEGIDGAGKNTQTQRLKARLEAEGFRVATLAFPRYGETFMARTVADYLNGKFGQIEDAPPHFPALLFAGDRLESRDLIVELLATHDVLLIDRYVASNLAHQGAKTPAADRRAFIEWLIALEHTVYRLPRPDLVLYLDVPVAVSAALVAKKKPRSYTTAAADLHEADHDHLGATRSVYALLAAMEYGAWQTIPCAEAGQVRSIDAIHADVWAAVQARLPA